MWWILGACLGTVLLGLELRRFRRDGAAERHASRHYALYRASDPERALAILEFGRNDAPRRASLDPPVTPPPVAIESEAAARDGSDRPWSDTEFPLARETAAAHAAPGLPRYGRRHRPPTSGGDRG